MEHLLRHKQQIEVYLKIALTISELSRCKNAKVGAIIVKDKNIISYGYNGTPSGFCNECEENGITKKEVLHAESNAILKAGTQANGANLFLTLSPCIDCCKLIKQAGINHVYFIEKYRDFSGLDILKIPYTFINLL
jgi:dCMP deaminase